MEYRVLSWDMSIQNYVTTCVLVIWRADTKYGVYPVLGKGIRWFKVRYLHNASANVLLPY